MGLYDVFPPGHLVYWVPVIGKFYAKMKILSEDLTLFVSHYPDPLLLPRRVSLTE